MSGRVFLRWGFSGKVPFLAFIRLGDIRLDGAKGSRKESGSVGSGVPLPHTLIQDSKYGKYIQCEDIPSMDQRSEEIFE
jgi:hypothetical protein